MILLHDNAPSHIAKLVKETIKAFGWEILSHAAYSPDLAPSDYHLFASMGHALAQQRFTSYEDVRKWLDDWFGSKEQQFFLAWHPQIVKQVEKMYSYRWAILRIKYFLSLKCNKRVFSIKNFGFIFTHLVRLLLTKLGDYRRVKNKPWWN